MVRHPSRLGHTEIDRTGGEARHATRDQEPVNLVRGLARARAATLLMLALPGSAYAGGDQLGRDGCRVPLPWSGTAPPFGFGPDGVAPWLPQPASWAALTLDVQRTDPDSTWSPCRSDREKLLAAGWRAPHTGVGKQPHPLRRRQEKAT